MDDKIKILIADDHRLVLDGLQSLFSAQDDIEVVATAINGREAIEELRKNPVDIAILDLNMPIMDGLEATIKIKQEFPEVKILMLTFSRDVRDVDKAFKAGVSGYMVKSQGEEELIEAIRAIQAGLSYYGSEIARMEMDRKYGRATSDSEMQLTPREIEVMKHIAGGLTLKEISEKLNIAYSTIETHRRNTMVKLGLRNVQELVHYAIENGFIKVGLR